MTMNAVACSVLFYFTSTKCNICNANKKSTRCCKYCDFQECYYCNTTYHKYQNIYIIPHITKPTLTIIPSPCPYLKSKVVRKYACLAHFIKYSNYLTAIDNLSRTLTFEERLGQIILLPKTYHPNQNKEIVEIVLKNKLGGVFFQGSIEPKNYAEFQEFTASLHNLPTKLPLLLACDQEGGKPFTFIQGDDKGNMPISPDYIGEINDYNYSYRCGQINGILLKNANLQISVAPVVDLGMSCRNLGDNFEKVHRNALGIIKGLHSKKIIATIKHYPANDKIYNERNLVFAFLKDDAEMVTLFARNSSTIRKIGFDGVLLNNDNDYIEDLLKDGINLIWSSFIELQSISTKLQSNETLKNRVNESFIRVMRLKFKFHDYCKKRPSFLKQFNNP